MTWNPETHDYCRNCTNYESVGVYVYELEENPAKRKCKHLRRCGRIATFYKNKKRNEQA